MVTRSDTMVIVDAFEKRGAEIRVRRGWLYAAQLVVAASTVLLITRLPNWGEYLFGAVAIIAAAHALGSAWRRWPRIERGDLCADPTGVYVRGRLLVSRETIRLAHVHKRGSMFVRLKRFARPVEIAVDDERQGDALIAALRLDPSRSVMRYHATDGTARRLAIRLVIIVLAFCVLSIGALALMVSAGLFAGAIAEAGLLVAYLLLLLRSNLSIVVGADGLRIRRWVGRARLLRYVDIDEIALEGPHVCFRLRSGELMTIGKGTGPRIRRFFGDDAQDEAEGFVTRVRARIDAHRGASDVTVRSLLVRGGRRVCVWLRALGISSDGAASFRTAAIPPEVLWSVVEDSTAPPTARVGAAVALRRRFDDAARHRLRVVADACVAPELRLAFEAATACDQGNLLGVLESVHDEDPGGR
jgi:hypothetical protein